MTSNQKPKLRASALRARRSLSDKQRKTASTKICERVTHSHEFMASKMVGCYLPTSDEVDPTNIIERAWCANKRVFVPVTDTHGAMNFFEIMPNTVVTRNHYGIWEPDSGTFVSAKQLDIVITPVAAFDAANNRIGMGGGYFDRCFRFLRNRCKWLRPKLIGVAFECQRVEKLVPDAWDVALYKTVTDAD